MKNGFLFAAFLLKFLLVATTYGQAPKAEEAEQPSIRLPILPADRIPVAPVTVTELGFDQFYIIESDVQCIVLASRVGYVAIVAETGPIKIRGQFADGNGKVQTRTYTGKFLYSVEAVNEGNVELLIVPAGATDDSTVLRRTLSVRGARPPPGPTPEPIPIPIPIPEPTPGPSPIPEPPLPIPAPVKAEVVNVTIIEDSLLRTPQSAALIADLEYWRSLEPTVKNVHIVPIKNKDGSPHGIAEAFREQINQVGSLPLVIIQVGPAPKGKILTAEKLPADKVEMSKLINKYAGK